MGTRTSGLGASVTALTSSYGPSRVAELARAVGLTPSGNRHDDVEALAVRLADPARVDSLVAGVDDQARRILGHLARGGQGRRPCLHRAGRRGRPGRPAVGGAAVARDRTHVSVPREVAICLRGGHTTRDRADLVPELATSSRDAALVDRAAAGAAFELVRHVGLLLEHWGTTPPSALRSGGLGVRELKAAAELLHSDERTAGLHVEVAFAADLLAAGTDGDGDAVWLPTDAFDIWSAAPVADRWARLALAWLDAPRLAGLVGGREAGKPVNALTADLERAWAPRPGAPHSARSTGSSRAPCSRPAPVSPRSSSGSPGCAPGALPLATGGRLDRRGVRGGRDHRSRREPAHGRALLSTDDPLHHAPSALAPLLPEPVDHVLLQADLAAVAPGPLEQDLARHLAMLADIESRGGATVYRFTERSVRRAFDSGWSAAEVHGFVASSSRTPVPQALTYLVDDVSRRFGTIRVGAAESFLRSDDETALTELVHHPQAASLRLRRIAPTVVVSDVPLDVLLPRLRELGSAPVVEAPDGTVRLARRWTFRARAPRRRQTTPDPVPLAGPLDAQAATRLAARAASTVTAVRAGDRAAEHRPAPALRASEPTTPASTLALLREAVESRSTVWMGYLDNHGSSVERVVDPVKVEAGWLSAYDHRTEDVRSFAVHRITAVRRLEA